MRPQSETAPVGTGRPRENVRRDRLNTQGGNKTPSRFQAANSRLIYLDTATGSAGMAAQLHREMSPLDFALLRKAVNAVGISKPKIIEGKVRT